MLRRIGVLATAGALAVTALAGCTPAEPGDVASGDTIKLGMLFSLTGGLSLGEVPMYNAAMLAVDEINAAGGIDGVQIEAVVEDYASDIQTAVEKANKLVNEDKTIATVGTYTSASRQAVLPTYQDAGNLLLYPVITEGLECSPNIIYTGAAPNQGVELAVPWMLENLGKKVYMVGSDYTFPHTVNAIVRALVEEGGGQIVGDDYFPLGHTDFGTAAAKIKNSGADSVFSSVVTDSVPPMYRDFAAAGISQADMPFVAVATTESELQATDPAAAAGSYAISPYFQTIDSPANSAFVKAATAIDNQPFTSREMAGAYNAVYLFKAALEKAGKGATTQQIIDVFPGISFDGPEGTITVQQNHYSTMNSLLGQVDENGAIQTVVDFGAVEADPYPPSVVDPANAPVCPTPYQG
jgi:ABC-type branched-subunit amino acid transport system substrate-binding protein